MTRVLIVCLANICRSPMAQSVTEAMARARGSEGALRVESAGLHVPRSGLAPDPRTVATLERRGYAATGLRTRPLQPQDFERSDLILAMDREVLGALRQRCPEDRRGKLHLFLDYAEGLRGRDVPDPYFGALQGFENVLDLCEAGARGLLEALERGLRSGSRQQVG